MEKLSQTVVNLMYEIFLTYQQFKDTMQDTLDDLYKSPMSASKKKHIAEIIRSMANSANHLLQEVNCYYENYLSETLGNDKNRNDEYYFNYCQKMKAKLHIKTVKINYPKTDDNAWAQPINAFMQIMLSLRILFAKIPQNSERLILIYCWKQQVENALDYTHKIIKEVEKYL